MIDLEFLIPFYGRPEYLYAAVGSIRALRDTRWQLTVVEDNHPDGPEVRRAIEGLDDPRIRYLRNETTLGANANTYRCIQLAEWDHFVMPGHDDLVGANYGQVVADLLAHSPDAAIVQPGVTVIDGDGRPHFPLADRVKKWIGPGRTQDVEIGGEAGVATLLRGNWLYTPACCYRREDLQKVPFRAGIDAAHDLAFIVDVLMGGGTARIGTESAFRYRRHETSHSSAFARNGTRFEQERRYFDTVQRECRERGWKAAGRAAQLRWTSRLNALSQAPQALTARDLTTLRKVLRHAAR